MLILKQILFICSLRAPFFFIVHSAILLFYHHSSISFFHQLAVYMLICILDILVTQKYTFTIISIILIAGLFLLDLPELTVIAISAIIYRKETYDNFTTVFMISILFVLTALSPIANPAAEYRLALYILITILLTILARYIDTLDFFFNSYFCREISQKTASSLYKRTCKHFLYCFTFFALIGFFLLTPVFTSQETERIQRTERGAYAIQEAAERHIELFNPNIDQEHEEAPVELLITLDLVSIVQSMYAVSSVSMYIITAFTGFIVLLLVRLLLIRMYRSAISRFDNYDDVIEESDVTKVTDIKKKKRKHYLEINQKVRRIFKKKVNKYIKKNIMIPQLNDTPAELADIMSKQENVDDLKRLYHKARYSDKTISKSELKLLLSEHRERSMRS